MKRRAFRPTVLKHDGANRGFSGEICPICRSQRLGVNLEHPVCMRCRTNLGLDADFLASLTICRITIDEETVNWMQQPHPTLHGTIDGASWIARHAMGKWLVESQGEDPIVLNKIVIQYLDSLTPYWLDRIKLRQTPFKRYCLVAVVGAAIVTAAILLARKKPGESDS